MSTTRKIAHNTIAQIIGKIISVVLGLIAIGMMTRYLGTDQFGWYITVISFLQFAGILIDFGMIPVTAQMMSEPDFDKEKLFKNLLGFRAASAILFFALAPAAAFFFPYPEPVKIAIAFTAVSFLGNSLSQVLIGLYQTRLQMHWNAIGEVLGRAVLILGLFLVMAQGASFLWVMGAVTIASIVHTLFLFFKAALQVSLGFSFDRAIWGAVLKKMWPIAISIVFNVVYLKGDVILLSLYRDAAEVGLYGAAYRVLDIITQTAMMVMGVMLPLLAFAWSRKLKQEFALRYQQAFDAMMALAVPMMTALILLAKPIIVFVAGADFMPAAMILQILSIAVFGVFLGAVFGHAAVAINKQKQVLWIYITDAVLTLIGYLIVIPKHGMTGAAWMTVFSELYAGVLLLFAVYWYARHAPALKTFFKIVFASAVMAGTLLLLQDAHILLVSAAGMVVYGAALFLIGGISKQTLKEIMARQ